MLPVEQVTFPGYLYVKYHIVLSAVPALLSFPWQSLGWLQLFTLLGSLKSLTPPFIHCTLSVLCEDFLYWPINYKLVSRNYKRPSQQNPVKPSSNRVGAQKAVLPLKEDVM